MNLRKSKTAKVVAGIVAFAFVVSFMVAPVTTKAQTTAELQAMINSLLAQIAALQGQLGGGSMSHTFTTDLTVGSTGAEVTALQQFLVSKGFLAMPAGVAMGYFGSLTQSAVAAFQAANGITPASGYFGPVTRAKVNSMGGSMPGPTTPTTPTSPSGLQGGAGSVESYELISGLTNEEVGEDEEDVEVAGLEIEADDNSDLEITAVRLVFDEGTAGSDFEDYATEVSVWFDGEEVGRADADEFNDDNAWTKTISLDGAVVLAGEVGELTVGISGAANLDSGDAGDTWTVDFRQIRFTDADGDSISEDPTTATRTFSFESFATAVNAELKISENEDAVNDAHVIDVHASDDTDDVALLSFTLEAEGDSDLVIDKLAASTTVTGASNVDDLVNSFSLWIDGEEVGTGDAIEDADGASVGTVETYLFDDIDYTIAAGDTVDAEIRADFNSVADALDEGDTIKVEITEAETDTVAMWDVEDESNEELVDADITGSATGEAHAVYDSGIQVEFTSVEETKTFAADASGEKDQVTFEFEFDVTAFGDDLYIDKDVVAGTTTPSGQIDGSVVASTTAATTGTTSVATTISGGTDTSDTSTHFFIQENDTRTFTISAVLEAGIDGVMQVQVTAIEWNTVGNADNSGLGVDQMYTFNLSDFVSDIISVNII